MNISKYTGMGENGHENEAMITDIIYILKADILYVI